MKNFTRLLLAGFLFLGLSGLAQSHSISGIVTDGTKPIAGASVHVKGSSVGTTTDMEGRFSIRAATGQTLVFSFFGFTDNHIDVATQTHIDVALKETIKQLDELVVVGYGVQKRSDLTGAVSSIDRDELLSTPSSSVGEMLRGRATGVQVTTNSGRPGAEPQIQIRGLRSISSPSVPLYVIDGSVSTPTEFNSINPNDIVSIDILKDAAALAVYGARAADGVILVTTQRGQSGQATITFDASVGLGRLWRNFDFYSPSEWVDLRREARYHDYNKTNATFRAKEDFTIEEVLGGDDQMIRQYQAGNAIDWEDMMFGSAITQQYNIGIRGGTDKTKVAAGLGYLNQDGILKFNSGYQRVNVRLNVDYEARKWLTVGFNTAFMKSQEKRENGNFNQFITRPPYGEIYDENGEYNQYLTASNDRNPLFILAHNQHKLITDHARLNGFVEIRPFKGFSYKFNGSYFNRFQEAGGFTDGSVAGLGNGTGQINNYKNQQYLIENIVNYNVPFINDQHKLNLTAVQAYESTIDKGVGYSATDIPVDREDGWNMIYDGIPGALYRTYVDPVLLSFVLRAQYNFKDRYLFTAAVRRDGSSKFGPGKKWGTFPSAAAAWRIIEEPFMKDVRALSNLKLRVSYGVVGNQNGIPPYKSDGLADRYPTEFGENKYMGYLPNGELPNPLIHWEPSGQLNLGLDFGFLNNRIYGTFEYYNTRTWELLMDRKIEGVLGYTDMWDNVAKTKTYGMELSLTGDIIRKQDLSWSITTNISTTKNEIITLGVYDDNGNPIADIGNNWFPGKPIRVYYMYEFAGIFQLDEFDKVGNTYVLKDQTITYPHQDGGPQPGSIKMRDINGDNKITLEDDQIVIPRETDMYYSISTSVNFKGFDLLMDFYGVHGRKIQNMYLYGANEGGSLGGKLNGVKVDYWTETNPSNTAPRPTALSSVPYHGIAALEDASYFRLRTLQLGYTLPAKITRKFAVERLRVYTSATNLFTITDFKSYSPEMIQGVYPEMRQWLFGINLTF